MNARNTCSCGRRCSAALARCTKCYAAETEKLTARLVRVNEALAKGGVYMINTAFGQYRVESFRADYWAMCAPVDRTPDWTNRRSFALHGGHVLEAATKFGVA